MRPHDDHRSVSAIISAAGEGRTLLRLCQRHRRRRRLRSGLLNRIRIRQSAADLIIGCELPARRDGPCRGARSFSLVSLSAPYFFVKDTLRSPVICDIQCPFQFGSRDRAQPPLPAPPPAPALRSAPIPSRSPAPPAPIGPVPHRRSRICAHVRQRHRALLRPDAVPTGRLGRRAARRARQCASRLAAARSA